MKNAAGKSVYTYALLLLILIFLIAGNHININSRTGTTEVYASSNDFQEVIIHVKHHPASTPLDYLAYAKDHSIDRLEIVKTLQHNTKKSQESILVYLERKKELGKVGLVESYFIANMVYAQVTAELVEEIEKRNDVNSIYPNEMLQIKLPESDIVTDQLINPSIPWNIENIRVPQVWHNYNLYGKDTVIGIIDSGVRLSHPALTKSWRGYGSGTYQSDYNWYDPLYERLIPDDEFGHGTSVLGIALGHDEDSNHKIGIAPQAKWIAARGFSDSGYGDRRSLLKAGQFMIAPTDINGNNPRSELAPDIIINAWGVRPGDDEWYREMVQNWRAAGIFSVCAVGNHGSGINAVINPASYPESFSVGAVDMNNKLASFSSRGPGAYEGTIKPEVVAPGVQILAISNEGYGRMNGTSLSAAHVAGVVSLLLSADPGLKVAEIEEILKSTALALTDFSYTGVPNYGYGYGLVDAYQAIESIYEDRWIILEGPEEAVILEETWRINLNRRYEKEEIVAIAIDRNNGIIPLNIDYYPAKKEIIVKPQQPYLPGEKYELRIHLANKNSYKLEFETICQTGISSPDKLPINP